MHDMIKKSQGHFVSDLFTWTKKGYTQDSSLTEFFFTKAFMHKTLNFQDISSSCISTTNDDNLNKFLDGVLDKLQSFKSCFTFILLTHE